jgi:hypothetical protein
MSSELATALIPDSARIKSDPRKIGDLWENLKPVSIPPAKLLFGCKFRLQPS